MRFGVCTEPDRAEALASAGFDFIEINVLKVLQPEAPDAEGKATRARLHASALPVEAANCFLPGDLKIVGDDVDAGRVGRYIESACARAGDAGIQTIVFGSGGARRVPDGFDRAKAWEQLVAFGRRLGPVAAAHGVTIVVEPLNGGECNVFNSVGECGRYVNEVSHPNIRLLVDAYHWQKDDNSYEDLLAYGPMLHHAHIATYGDRLAPGRVACDFAEFFRALQEGGYDGRVSIEGKWGDLAAEAPAALQALREAAASAG